MEKLGLVDAASMKIQNNSYATTAFLSGEDHNGIVQHTKGGMNVAGFRSYLIHNFTCTLANSINFNWNFNTLPFLAT